jgi:hypothetical protein
MEYLIYIYIYGIAKLEALQSVFILNNGLHLRYPDRYLKNPVIMLGIIY